MIVLSARLKRDPFHGRASFEVADPVVVPESRVVLTEAISETIFRLRWSAWRVSVIVQCLAAASQRQSLCNGQFSLAFDGSLFAWQSPTCSGSHRPSAPSSLPLTVRVLFMRTQSTGVKLFMRLSEFSISGEVAVECFEFRRA